MKVHTERVHVYIH